MPSCHPPVKYLLDWCDAHGVLLDPRIEILHDGQRGMHILSRDTPISTNTTLARIPKGSVLSARSCSLSEFIPFELHGLEAQLGLTFALYSEMLKGHLSNWFGYIQSLPAVDLPVFWPSVPKTKSEEELDLYDPMIWFRGTEVHKLLHSQENKGPTLRENIDSYYYEVVAPTLQKPEIRHVLAEEPQLITYHQAYSLVSSRAFLVDSYHGLAMIPVADVFNHSLENHVHLEADFYVCSTCGSLNECEHDNDAEDIANSENPSRTTKRDADHDLYYEMVSNREISPYEEVFNTYGETLSNAQLLVQYGFIIDPNDNDIIGFDLDEILNSISLSNPEKCVLAVDNAELALSVGLSSASNLVFSHNTGKTETGVPELCINSDGQISHQLWTLLLKIGQRLVQGGQECSSPYDMEEIANTQLWLEEVIGEGGIDWKTNNRSTYTQLILEVARLIVKLCDARKKNIGWSGKPIDDLGDLVDTIPEHMNRTRLSLCVVLCEISIIDSCKTGWSDIVDVLEADL